jgi:hypothetical protein
MAAAAVELCDRTGTPLTTPPGTTPPRATGACAASYRQINSWVGGFQGEVTVRAVDAAVNGWRVGMSFPGGTTVTQVWNGAASGSGSSYAVRNLPGNASITPWMGRPHSGSSAAVLRRHRPSRAPARSRDIQSIFDGRQNFLTSLGRCSTMATTAV